MGAMSTVNRPAGVCSVHTPMHVRVVRPDHLSPEDLDDYLAQGWFRIGQALMTCRVVQFDGVLRPAIWTRLPLVDHRFKKSARRVLTRNAELFRAEVGPVVLDDEREDLYQRYRQIARGERSSTLADFLYGESDRDVFDTREVRVWDGDRLVAFSWFDLGRESVQSLIGVYDPTRTKQSLGFYTMLLEVEHAVNNGLRFHYPGYVLPGDPAMDYKLRLGDVEFLDPWNRDWRPLPELDRIALPTERLDQALRAARDALLQIGVPAEIRRYPWFEAQAWQPDLAACLDQPVVVECFPAKRSSSLLLVTYEVDRGSFALVRCLRARAVTRGRSEADVPIELWLVAERIASRTTPEAIAAEVARIVDGGMPVRSG
jgi:arginyl-tRNA--protein-N-Asp/Glu arginylyltransferase